MRGGAGWLAGAAGVAAVGSAAGVSLASSLRRRVSADDPHRDEDFELLDADRSCVVTTPDGVPLAVREVGPENAPLTVVFAHGFCLRMGSFHFQRACLTEHWGKQVRMVFYDQRGHGQSGEASPDTYTVEQLGQDLESVLAVIAPRGPVVLVGHSMGGMTVLSHARQYPQRYPTRIVGAALISSAAEGVARSPLGEILKNPALEAVRFTARYAPKMVHRGRGAARSVIGPILRAASYGDEGVSPSVVAFSERMMHDTPIATLVEFLHALEVHDETAGLETLNKIETLVACGDRDLLTPMEYSQEMADALAKSELVIVGGAGHLVQLERPEVIDDALVRLVERATPSKLTALTRRVRDRVRNHG
ncbi:putative hydrolase or acyltransferase of alpha/beta superfamily [Mycolicibacterium aurum]|uniref:Putative hydrolase or acyltransferase of alpha/beta superfamily n=1 Tax=Mycolicibacterium aurum TaxID=1791 RepID=A0A3S4RNE9_MYCAU|nr:alpha/beta hydrolase [Mycolicibacterium aurum]VEG52089.1 putative hydrolase or acyltransferase of alpha/beta superfamily [Mycolicibacterium aurum]